MSTLAKALIEGTKVRRESWPDGVFVQTDTIHKIGSSPVTIVDIDSSDAHPPGVQVRFTLLRNDPKSRVYPRRDLGAGLCFPMCAVVHFMVQDWQPSIEDLFAEDWITL